LIILGQGSKAPKQDVKTMCGGLLGSLEYWGAYEYEPHPTWG